jgi:hypothetical protein
MKEFRKMRIQREISELLSTFDPAQQPLQLTPIQRPFHPRHTVLALLFGILGVLMGQGVTLKAINADTFSRDQFAVSDSDQQLMPGLSDAVFPELPEIEAIYVPNLVQAYKPIELQK